MATARPFETSENYVPGPTSILLVGHSFVRRLVDYLQDQHVDNFNLCHESYKVNVLASGGLTMPKLWKKISDILIASPDIVYAEISSNDIAVGRDPLSLADDVYNFANALLANGIRTVVLGQVFFRDSSNSHYATIADFNDRVVVYNNRMVEICASSDAIMFWRHRGIWQSWWRYLLDGLHFNSEGHRKFFNSVRGALVAACKLAARRN